MSTGEKIRVLREQAEVSQSALATDLGLTRPMLSYIETGRIPVIPELLEDARRQLQARLRARQQETNSLLAQMAPGPAG